MTKNYKTIKNLLLLGTLSIFCYSSASTMEVDSDKLVIKITSKRNPTQAGLESNETTFPIKQSYENDFLPKTEKQIFLPKDILDKEEDGSFKQSDSGLSVIECLAPTEKSAFGERYLPLEMIDYMIRFLDLSKDQNTLLTLSITNTKLHALVENMYTAANKHENHRPWQVSLPLTKSLPSTLYILNTRLRTILGLYANIRIDLSRDSDRIHFERLCSRFIINPLFLKHTLPARYVELLQLHLGVTDPTLFQASFVDDWQNLLTKKRQICSRELSAIVSQQNFEFQNEGALYFHYCEFVANMSPMDLASRHSTPLFKELNNSFMGLMNKELSDLKATPGLSNEGNFAPTWEKILALEPVITIEQYYMAASSLGKAGKAATDPDIKFKKLTKAYEYYERELEAIIGARQTPAATNYGNIATAYFNAGVWATSQYIKFKSFTKAYEYHEKKLEAMKAEGQAPKANHYGAIAQAYQYAADAATEQGIKFKCFTKAYEYYEKKLEAMKAEGQAPKANDYNAIAYAYQYAADAATDLDIQFKSITKAYEYEEKKLEAMKAEAQAPKANDYNAIAYAFLKAGLCATERGIRFKSFTKAYEYNEKKFEAMKAEGRAPNADDYAVTAYSCFHAGAAATDNNVKFDNFTKAKAYFEIYLKMELNLQEVENANKRLNEINTYLIEYKKTAFDTAFNEQPLGG